jgi:hypothetical protein
VLLELFRLDAGKAFIEIVRVAQHRAPEGAQHRSVLGPKLHQILWAKHSEFRENQLRALIINGDDRRERFRVIRGHRTVKARNGEAGNSLRSVMPVCAEAPVR